jgi:hypothetical protein
MRSVSSKERFANVTFGRMNRPIAPSFITSVPSPSSKPLARWTSQPAKATTILHQDQTHGFRLRPCPSRAPVPGHGNRETGALFRHTGNRLKLLAWAHLSLEGRSNQDRSELRGQVPAIPLGHAWRAPPVVCSCYIDGEVRKPSGFDTYLLHSTEICSLGWTRSGWYTSRRTSLCFRRRRAFSRACAGGGGRGPNGTPSIRKSGDCWIMFYDRDLLERRQPASFDKHQLDQFRR